MSESLIIEIHNGHIDDCGRPPAMTKRSTDNFYCSYFESSCGDQWLFIFNRTTRTGYFWGGDIEWKRYEVRDNRVQDTDLILGDDEYQWLKLCWKAATFGEELEPLMVHKFNDIVRGKPNVEAVEAKP